MSRHFLAGVLISVYLCSITTNSYACNQTPIAGIKDSVTPDEQSVCVGTEVELDGSDSRDWDGDVIWWAWDIDKWNSTTEEWDYYDYELGEFTSHTFSEPGKYRIELWVEDDDYASCDENDTDECYVYVIEVASVTVDETIAAVNETVTFTAHPNPSGCPLDCIQWQKAYRKNSTSSWGAWESASGGDNTAQLNTSTSGLYKYRARNGSGDTWKESDEVTVFKVESITGLGNLYCSHADCSETVTAVLTNGVELPEGYSITWGGDATFSNILGRTATAKFAGHVGKNKKITAKVGTQDPAADSSTYTVVDHTPVTGVTTVTYNFVWQNPGADYGVTSPQHLVADITAYFGHPSHEWKCKVTNATDEIRQGSHLVAGVSEASVAAATTEAIYRKMVADLQARGEGAGVQWYMVAAVEEHETVHSDDWQDILNPRFTTFRTTVEALSALYADATCETPAQARTAILTLPAYTTAVNTLQTDCATDWNASPPQHPGCDQDTNAAEDAVTGPMITALDAHAAAQTPPWTR